MKTLKTAIIQFDLRTEGQSPKRLYVQAIKPKRTIVAERIMLRMQTDGLIVRLYDRTNPQHQLVGR